MGKVKKNVRAKAKSAVAAVKQKAQNVQAQINKASRDERLLHRTLTPRNTATKKEKSALKHKKLLNRFAELKKDRKEEQARKQREKTGGDVVGNLKPLRDALPSLKDIYDLVKSKRNAPEEQQVSQEPVLSAKQKIKKKRTQLVNRVNSFEKLIKDKNFRNNPREVIAAHVRNKYNQMDEEDE
ncbi:protein FAM207A [Scaptodrosophila lebanonensis]|uniref:Protein FAM207A n=1 Tax=Drosophila lebanonensis TaxID=7225 RepID=A0A6J2UD88_DROLE|nr:protein FAM207A [Scaptodrosophila lebanonensis]